MPFVNGGWVVENNFRLYNPIAVRLTLSLSRNPIAHRSGGFTVAYRRRSSWMSKPSREFEEYDVKKGPPHAWGPFLMLDIVGLRVSCNRS